MIVDCDVVVIGGGIAGAGVAAELSRDRRVVVLEQEAQPGFHATGRSAALHSETYGNASIRALTRASREFFLSGVDGQPFATPRGCVHIAVRHQLDRLDAFHAEIGATAGVTRLSGNEARTLVPVLRADSVMAALFERHAYDLDVDAIHRAFLKRLRDGDGTLHCTSGVTDCAFDEGWTVRAGEQAFRAPVLVNAAGAWGDVVADIAKVKPIGLEPKRRSAMIVDAPAGADPSRWPAVFDIEEQYYFKPDAGRILMSPADETPVLPHDAYSDDLDLAIAVERIQQVADIPVDRIAYSWAGLRTFVPDRTPVVGFDPEVPSFFWLVGQGGYGIQTSPALSRLAAALIRNEPMPHDLVESGVRLEDLSPSRLRTAAARP